MKTRIAVLPLLILLSAGIPGISATVPLFSQENLSPADPVEEQTAESKPERVVDSASLLTPAQKSSLVDRLNSLSDQYQFDLVIVTENSIGNANPRDYADDFFDYNNFGFGADGDGCLFLIVIGSRDYWISTSGRGINILNRSAYEKLESDALRFMKENNFYAAFTSFTDNWERLLIRETQGESYHTRETKSRSYTFFEQQNIVVVLVGWLIAFIIGLIVVHVWKKGMNTAFLQTQADSYVVSGSLAFDTKTDRFLYSTVTKTARQTDQGSSASFGGIHTGSSGRSHGGGGGKF